MKWTTWANRIGSMFGREKLREKLVKHDPTANYRAQPFFASELVVNELPLFTLYTARLMERSDPVVSFSLNVRNAALMALEVEVEAKNPRVKEWVEKQWRTLWDQHRAKLINAKRWGYAAAQPKFKEGPDGLLHISGLKTFAPHDVRALTYKSRTVGFQLRNIKMYHPFGVWQTFGAEFNSPYGTGLLRRQYPPWYEKWMDRGAKKLVQLRMIKDAYIGDIFWYPPDHTITIPTADGPVQLAWRDVFREVGENRLSGGAMTLPLLLDAQGNEMSKYQPPQAIPGASQVFEWEDRLDKQILRGADVPLEVIEAQENGGFSGRSVPLMVLLGVCTGEGSEIVANIDEHLLRPAAWLTFGQEPEYTIKAKSLVKTWAAEASGSAMGGGAMGGQAGQRPQQPGPPEQSSAKMGWVSPKGEVTQFDDSHWVTIGGRHEGNEEHKGGFPVQIDGEGRIIKSGGPQALIGKHVSEVGQHFGEERRTAAREQETKDWGSRKGWNTIVDRQSARWRIKPEVYEQIADQVWSEKMQHHGEREAAKQYARKRLNLDSGDLSRLENQGLDVGSKHKRIKDFDTTGREMASMFPALGWGEGYGSGGDRDYSEDLWDLVKEGKQTLPAKSSREYHQAIDEFLSAEWDRHKKRSKQLVKDDEPADSSQFSDYLAEQFDEGGQTTDDIAALGAQSARSRIRGAASRIRALKKNELTPLSDLANLIENELYDLRRGISSDLSASMLGGQLAGFADAWTSLPEDFTPPPTEAASPPQPPSEPPSIASLLGPDEPPRVSFPVVEDALEVLAEAPAQAQPDYHATAAAVKQGAFAITGDLTDKAVSDVRDLLTENLAKGPDREAFVDAVIDRLGEGGPLSEAHVEQIFRTNVATALSDGQDRALKAPMVVDAFPYRAYYATTDTRVRKNHLALERLGLDGTNIYRADDPVWAMFRPPWAYGCRCAWSPVSVEQAARRGVTEAKEWLARAVAMATELGGSASQYYERTAPAAPQWVSPPDFQPSPEFSRAL